MFLFKELTLNYPILGPLNGIILLLGLYNIGNLFSKIKSLKILIENISEFKYQNILISCNIISLILLPIILISPYSKYLIYFTSIIIYIFGIFQILKIKNHNLIFNIKNYHFTEIITFIVLISYFLLSLAPITHGDALAYHTDVAKNILINGTLPTEVFNFHHLLVGSGETLMSIGFFFSSEQFTGLLQFSGLISLYGLFKKKINKENYFLLLLALSSPIIIFLISASKPQLFSICSNLLVFTLIFLKNIKYSNKTIIYSSIILINIFLINSINTKFSFILSSSLLFIYFMKVSHDNKFLKETIFVSFIMFIIFYLPFLIWKFQTFGGSLYEYFYNPFTLTIPGAEIFKTYLVNFKRALSPLFLIIPKDLGVLTDNLGLGALLFFAVFLVKRKFNFKILLGLFIIISYLIGQPSSRFFLEPYLWTILFLLYNFDHIRKFHFLKLTAIQTFFSVSIVWAGIFLLVPGSINANLRDQVLSKSADGYSLFKWANQSLKNDNSAIISIHRAIGFGENKTISTDYLRFNTNIKEGHIRYINEIKKYKPKYLITWGQKDNVLIFKNCISKLHSFKKRVGHHGTRNPFNKGGYYDGFLYELKDGDLIDCIN